MVCIWGSIVYVLCRNPQCVLQKRMWPSLYHIACGKLPVVYKSVCGEYHYAREDISAFVIGNMHMS